MFARSTTVLGQVGMLDQGIAYVHRAHRSADGACARVTWSQVDPTRLDSVIETFRTEIMPKVEQLKGFCSVSNLVDRATGRGCLTATYDSVPAMAAAGDTAMGLRADLVEQFGLQVMEIAEFELCLAHLAVPELV